MKKMELSPENIGGNRYVLERNIYTYFQTEPDVMTVPEAAKVLRCGKNSLYDLIREGRLRAIRIGNRLIVPKSALVEFILNEKNYTICFPCPNDLHWISSDKCDMLCADQNGGGYKT